MKSLAVTAVVNVRWQYALAKVFLLLLFLMASPYVMASSNRWSGLTYPVPLGIFMQGSVQCLMLPDQLENGIVSLLIIEDLVRHHSFDSVPEQVVLSPTLNLERSVDASVSAGAGHLNSAFSSTVFTRAVLVETGDFVHRGCW